MCVIVLFSSFLHAACISRVSSSYLIKKPWNVRSVRWHILSMRRWKKSVWDDEDMNSWRLSPEIPQLLWVIVGSGWRFSWFPALSKNKVKNKENPENWGAWIFHFFLKYFFCGYRLSNFWLGMKILMATSTMKNSFEPWWMDKTKTQHFISLLYRQHVYEKISDFPHPPKNDKKPNAIKLSKQLSFFYNSFHIYIKVTKLIIKCEIALTIFF